MCLCGEWGKEQKERKLKERLFLLIFDKINICCDKFQFWTSEEIILTRETFVLVFMFLIMGVDIHKLG